MKLDDKFTENTGNLLTSTDAAPANKKSKSTVDTVTVDAAASQPVTGDVFDQSIIDEVKAAKADDLSLAERMAAIEQSKETIRLTAEMASQLKSMANTDIVLQELAVKVDQLVSAMTETVVPVHPIVEAALAISIDSPDKLAALLQDNVTLTQTITDLTAEPAEGSVEAEAMVLDKHLAVHVENHSMAVLELYQATQLRDQVKSRLVECEDRVNAATTALKNTNGILTASIARKHGFNPVLAAGLL